VKVTHNIKTMATATATAASGTTTARRGSSDGCSAPPVRGGLQRSDSLELFEAAMAPPMHRPSSCAASSAMTAETENSESFSSLLSAEGMPPSASNQTAPAHTSRSKMASAAFFESAFFSQMQSSSLSLPDDLLMGSGSGGSAGSGNETRPRRGGRRRTTNHGGGNGGNGPSLLERAMALEVPALPTELLLLVQDVDMVDHRGTSSSRRSGTPAEGADSARQTREEDKGDVVDVTQAPAKYDATIRNYEEYRHSHETSPDASDSILVAAPSVNPVVVCQCCYEELDPQTTMQTFSCSESTLAEDEDGEDDDDELNALPPKPPLVEGGNSSRNSNHNHAVCAHCLASYVHEWVFGGTSYPLRKQRRRVENPVDSADAPDQSITTWELPCLSSDCPNGSYPRHVVQSAISSQAMEQYDQKVQQIYNGPKAKLTTATETAAPQRDADNPARPPSPARSRDQLTVEETLTERRIRRCAVCCAAFVKESNTCNKIRCPHCNFRFCFVCLTDLPAKGYDHFCTHQYDSACDACVREGTTCHLWSHEHDDSESKDDDDNAAADGMDNAIRETNHQEQPRKALARNSSAAGKDKADRFLGMRKLLLPTRKGHNKA
jgi:hypothetical protein